MVKLSVGIDQRNFVSLGREFSAQRTRTPAGSRPRRFVSSLRDSRILARFTQGLRPGLILCRPVNGALRRWSSHVPTLPHACDYAA